MTGDVYTPKCAAELFHSPSKEKGVPAAHELPGGGEASLDAQGRISFNSFKTAVVSLGLATTEARRIFDHFDPGGTGYINFSELRAEVRATATSLSHTLLLIHGRGEERARARMPRALRSHVCVFVARLSYRS